MIENLLSLAKHQNGSITFLPSPSEEIIKTNAFLTSQNFAEIPTDYQEFLKLSNGFIYNGIELMGTVPHPRPDKRYIFPDLIQINKPYIKYDYFDGKLLIGTLSESFMLYDSAEQIYAVLDRINLRSRIEVSDMSSLFAYIMELCGINS